MAHVLLPCDLPTWNDVQRHLGQLKMSQEADQMIQGMAKIYDICCITLDPENSQPKDSQGRFDDLKKFINEVMSEKERSKFLSETLPCLVSQALCLKLVKPGNGFHYSLMKEDQSFSLDRSFVTSLLANAFFSTFPKRTAKTHPTLQDFNFSDFFRHLNQPNHQKKFMNFLEYFDTLDLRKKGTLRFSRKVLEGNVLPTLPGWLCSDRPLVPLAVRHESRIDEAEACLFRACPCSPAVGGDVLQTAASQESNIFFEYPELLVSLCFVESLKDSEALLVEGISSLKSSTGEINLCLLDATDFSIDLQQQFEDRYLLRELNKALASFTQPLSIRIRHNPVGESSSSSTCPDQVKKRRKSSREDSVEQSSNRDSHSGSTKKLSKGTSHHASEDGRHSDKCPRLPPITKTASGEVFYETQSVRSSQASSSFNEQVIASRPRPTNRNGADNNVSEWPRLPGQVKLKDHSLRISQQSGSRSSSKWSMSLKTASQSSVEILPPIKQRLQQPLDEEYYTADEDSDSVSDAGAQREDHVHQRLLEPPRVTYTTKQHSDASRYSRTESMGFVLDGASDEDDYNLNQHERLDDFRKRIRRRTRHLSRRSSRSSYVSSSGSSDMEDISEDPEISYTQGYQIIRPSSSEPSLLQLEDGMDPLLVPPFSLPPDSVVLSFGGRKMMVTSSKGQLKAYSYDGVNPNLPVPFKAKFRRRHHSADKKNERGAEENFWYVAPPTGSAVTSAASSDEDQSKSKSSVQCPARGDAVAEQLLCSASGKRAVAASSSWGCNRQGGDNQLKAFILWLAASMAGLPSLIFYTDQEPTLQEITTVQRKILSRHWTVGDLSCEILRFCRNRLAPRQRLGSSPMLFTQIVSSGSSTYSQLSLD